MTLRHFFGPWTALGLVLGLVICFAGYFVSPFIWIGLFAAMIGLNAKQLAATQVSCGILTFLFIPLIGLLIYSV
ncbi:hypothetical protein [Nocardia sp. 348MFTsu5.1]|uniref:hypothetical protein n=1 Tax=Nocardia sp. 348MFTsu5.1 TaxID=1172185 RepID=UPI000377E964|nr:hypothetical protein [Nocardia sp. 348MFTsu5.1]